MAPLKLFSFFPFFLLFFLQPSTNGEICLEAMCGNVRVDYPFRLADQPECCGNPSFNLSCRNQNQTIITFPFAGEFIVDIISYSPPSLPISDPGECIPKRLLQGFDLSGTPFGPKYPAHYIFFNCYSNVALSVDYPAIPFYCLSGANFSVMAIPEIFYNQSSPLRLCQEIATILIPLPFPDFPKYFIFNLLLTWKESNCGSSCNCKSYCQLENDDGCSKKKTGLSKGTKHALIFILGIPLFFLLAFLTYYNAQVHHLGQRRPSNVEISSLAEPQAAATVNGLDGPRIEAYPITVLGESCRLPRLNDNTCSICLAEYQPKETIRTIPDCNHYFHANCIEEWLKLNAACPVCRSTPDQETALINHSRLSSSSSPQL